MLRTHTCGELRITDNNKKVILCGWVNKIRKFGKITFLDLRDRFGITQIIIKEPIDLKLEYCIQIEGSVVKRKDKNTKIQTGEIEIISKKINVFNKSPIMPFDLTDNNIEEELRLKYRFLDLRREKMKKNVIIRHKIVSSIHKFMAKKDFLHIETPILAKSTPEGARDYIVPSRIHPEKFYALPQSPQIFKQLSMIAGLDKYYQIARCFRDEDQRADRQPEFTQLDVEMSFIEEEDIFKLFEEMFQFIFKEILNMKLKTPFPRLSYEEAIKKYKKDNPDIRKNPEKENFSFVWITDFPAFEYNEENKRWQSKHHPFTSLKENPDFSNPKKIKSKAYDLVLNGSEIGGGSIRIHSNKIQSEVFKLLGISEKEIKEKFGFLLNALSYGAPPHGGIAFGLDRIIQILLKAQNIREVITFPKNQYAKDLMIDAPSKISEKQLTETHIAIKKDKMSKKHNAK